jgi:hypothetical protein
MIVLIILLSILSAILYRAGGMDRQTKHWLPVWARKSWVRDWICPACCLLPLLLKHPSFWFIPAYGALGGMFSTYWDWMFKGEDNYWFSGFMCGAVGLLLIPAGVSWLPLIIRALFIAIGWGAWCKIFSNDFVEEYGRGFIVSIATIIFFSP